MILAAREPALRAFVVRCLACGARRIVRRAPRHGLDRPDCPLCGYVGWVEARTGLDRLQPSS